MEPKHLLPHSQVSATQRPEIGIRAVGNKKVTAILDPQHPPLD